MAVDDYKLVEGYVPCYFLTPKRTQNNLEEDNKDFF